MASALGRIQGGGPGVQGPPLVPREGVLDPSSKMKKTAFIIARNYGHRCNGYVTLQIFA